MWCYNKFNLTNIESFAIILTYSPIGAREYSRKGVFDFIKYLDN